MHKGLLAVLPPGPLTNDSPKLIGSSLVHLVYPSLVDKYQEDDVISEDREAMEGRHLDDEGKQIINNLHKTDIFSKDVNARPSVMAEHLCHIFLMARGFSHTFAGKQAMLCQDWGIAREGIS